MSRQNGNGLSNIKGIISRLLPNAKIWYPSEYCISIKIGPNKIDLPFARSTIEDYESAIKNQPNTNYFFKLENRIKFQIYSILGKEGLLSNFNVSTEYLNEKGEWKTKCVSAFFSVDFNEILNNGLKILSNSLDDILKSQSIEVPSIEKDKYMIDVLINFYERNRTLSTSGTEPGILSYLKAAAVCVIMDLENKKMQSAIPRVMKEYDKQIYSIVHELEQSILKEIQLPECIHDYATHNRIKNKAEKEKVRTDKLDELLEKLDFRLKKKRAGAWETFYSDNPDRLSQSANSMVELLDKVIGKICKTKALKDYLREKYHSDAETSWVEATRKWISETKNKLHRVKHHEDYKLDTLAEELLKSAESVILFLLD